MKLKINYKFKPNIYFLVNFKIKNKDLKYKNKLFNNHKF